MKTRLILEQLLKLTLIALSLFALTLLSACAKPGDIQNAQSVQPPTQAQPDPTPAAPICAIYDSCTYSGGFSHTPVYNCVEVTYQIADHPEIPTSYFEGKDCLTTREDFHQVQSMCGPPNFQFPCQVSVQGPGPKAIPDLGL